MKIGKIKLIERPIDDIRLDAKSMAMLFGGTSCEVLRGNHCDNYSNGPSCHSSTTIRCGCYSW